jgi:hypothetical protein
MQTGVAQKFLQGSEVDAGLEQMGRKGMPEKMGVQPSKQTRPKLVMPQKVSNAPVREGSTPAVDPEVAVGSVRCYMKGPFVEIPRQGCLKCRQDRDRPLLPPLPTHPDPSPGWVQVLDGEPDQLTHAKTHPVEKSKDQGVPQMPKRVPPKQL